MPDFRGDQMQFGPLNVTILVRQGAHIYARKGQAITIQIDGRYRGSPPAERGRR